MFLFLFIMRDCTCVKFVTALVELTAHALLTTHTNGETERLPFFLYSKLQLDTLCNLNLHSHFLTFMYSLLMQ